MNRRDFILAGCALGLGLSGCQRSRGTTSQGIPSLREGQPADYAGVFVPGYRAESAHYKGLPATADRKMSRALPRNYAGTATMLTRIGHDGGIQQAIFPIRGHGVHIAPDATTGVFSSLEGRTLICFDADTLDVVSLAPPHKADWVFGGHAAYTADARHLLVVERAPLGPYQGRPEAHYGAISVRDPVSLQVADVMSCHGIAPHELKLLGDGSLVAVANYGSVPGRDATDYGFPRQSIEPCATVVDVNSGRLAHKVVVPDTSSEPRHIAGNRLDRLFVVQSQVMKSIDAPNFKQEYPLAHERDFTFDPEFTYLPAPVVRIAVDGGTIQVKQSYAKNPRIMRHGLSVIFDPVYGEVLVTYVPSHRVLVLDGASGAVKREIETDKFGLRYPCGIAFLPDKMHYVVTGFWENMFVFRRGSHELNREACRYQTFFGHSHIAAA